MHCRSHGRRAEFAEPRLHCCAARRFERMYRAMPDVLSFDAMRDLICFSLIHVPSISCTRKGRSPSE